MNNCLSLLWKSEGSGSGSGLIYCAEVWSNGSSSCVNLDTSFILASFSLVVLVTRPPLKSVCSAFFYYL